MSEPFREFSRRVRILMKRYLPPISVSGTYTSAQQDQMRALRMLFHAEVEHLLEHLCNLLIGDLERELSTLQAGSSVQREWATKAVKNARKSVIDNNGVKEKNIIQMFGELGFAADAFNEVSPLFLDRMSDLGSQRGDVAHKSAIKATYSLNRTREEKFLNEIIKYLHDFDSLIARRRLRNVLT